MNYIKENLGFSTNKQNRKIKFTVRLKKNVNSWNRSTDTTPRYWLDPVSILSVERIAFTNKALEQGKTYQKEGHRIYDNVGEAVLSDAEIEVIFDNLKHIYPYGYRANDTSSKQKYIIDAMKSDAFQSHYASYWNNNLDKVVPEGGPTSIVHPYIEYETSEIISTKHNVGDVPAIEGGSALPEADTGFRNVVIYDRRWNELLCDSSILDVSVPSGEFDEIEDLRFYVNDSATKPLQFDAEGETEHVVRFVEPWPLMADNTTPSGIAFKLSETPDGVHHYKGLGVEEHGLYAGAFDHELVTYVVTMAGSPEQVHLDGVTAPAITMIRGSEYRFDQSDVSNVNHRVFVSTDSHGGDLGDSIYCQVQERNYVVGDDGEGTLTFKVPFDAPDTLYYQCEGDMDAGGAINIVTPTVDYPSPGGNYENFVPGRALKIMLPAATPNNASFYYYNHLLANMGGAIFGRDCTVKCPGEAPDTLGVAGSYAVQQII